MLLTLGAVVVSTYAWYVYNTGRHTTKVRMAAGAGINLQISNAYDGVYGSAAVLDSIFACRLVFILPSVSRLCVYLHLFA